MMDTSNCKGCHKKMIWATTPEGKKIPLDAKAPVYLVEQDGEGTYRAIRQEDTFVTHFATCPKANDF